MKIRYLIIFTGISLAGIMFGCNQRIIPPIPTLYNIQGAVVRNIDNDSTVVTVTIKKSDTLASSLTLLLGTDTLKYSSGVYKKSYNSDTALTSGTHEIKLIDGDYADSISFTIPSDVDISNVSLPDTRIDPGGLSVPFEWTIASGSIGYAYGVIMFDSTYISSGFYQFVTTGATQTSIPPDAFRLSGHLDTGWYRVYVYAYSGVPIGGQNLPTGFPQGLTLNLSQESISGSFGAIVVSRPDSIQVVIE